MRRRYLRAIARITAVILGVVAVLALVAALTGFGLLRGSLARLDGRRALPGLDGAVLIERDAQGVPRITADTRLDAARALGWLHAQDRFFQMDLLRRAAAGELAALLGPSMLPTDQSLRRHRFAARLEAALIAFDEPSRALLDAYAVGVNAGLRDLRARPPEYLLLRQQPRPWRPLDSLLVVAAMYLDLGLSTADTDLAAGRVRDTLPPELAAFLLPGSGHWDAPLQDGGPPPPAVPTAALSDVFARIPTTPNGAAPDDRLPVHDRAGSNSWAVAGRLSRHGGALLANDMHLGLGLPNIWYRAELRVGPRTSQASDAVGVTLPGTPAVVAGSNGRVAWGFTNAYADWLDLVVLETDPADPDRYLTPDGWETFRMRVEVIAVAGAAPDTFRFRESHWGPVWAQDTFGRPLALRWAAHDPGAINVELARMVDARTVDDAVALAPLAGIPGQNLVCADRDGCIAWTIAGRVPRRVGWSGRWPASWADGTCRWEGWIDAADQPRLVDPPEGRLWSANNRLAADADLVTLGDGGYGLGARATQIRDGLRALDHPDEADMLALQLDDRALMLDQWRGLALAALDQVPAPPDSVTKARRARFRQIARENWDGRASVGSVGYRVVRSLTGVLLEAVYTPLTEPCRRAGSGFDDRDLPLRHAVAWELLTQRPVHLLPPLHRDWDQLVAAAVDTTMARLSAGGRPDSTWTWGARNTVKVAHPFADVVTRLHRWLAAPSVELPGDSHLPRVQHPSSGASERLVVSPGREAEGLFHMPGGQSGHPLSPFWLAGHADWVQGRAAPLLPGPALHVLRLEPDHR